MREWRIGDLIEPIRTWNPLRETSQGSFVYVDLSTVDYSSKEIVGARSLPYSEAPSRARQLISAGDVLVSTVRPNLNGVARVSKSLSGATASTGFCVLRPRADILDSSYLFHWVKTSMFVNEMVRNATGASYPAVSDRIVMASIIPLPPLAEQKRIAGILDKAEELRAQRRHSLARLDSLAQSIFLEMFGDPVRNEKGWENRILSDIIQKGDTINYGVVQPGDNVEAGVPLIRVGDLSNGGVNSQELKQIDPVIESRYKRSRLRGDEILVSCVGSIGIVALADLSLVGFNIARAIARIPLADKADRLFMAEYLRTEFVQQYFTRELRTVSQPTLNIKQISETSVILPPLPLQQEFARRVAVVERLKEEGKASLATLDTLFLSLQQRAFSGRL